MDSAVAVAIIACMISEGRALKCGSESSRNKMTGYVPLTQICFTSTPHNDKVSFTFARENLVSDDMFEKCPTKVRLRQNVKSCVFFASNIVANEAAGTCFPVELVAFKSGALRARHHI